MMMRATCNTGAVKLPSDEPKNKVASKNRFQHGVLGIVKRYLARYDVTPVVKTNHKKPTPNIHPMIAFMAPLMKFELVHSFEASPQPKHQTACSKILPQV